MKTLMAMFIAGAATFANAMGASAQQNLPFCLRAGDGKLSCRFETIVHCEEALKRGPTKAGACIINPFIGPYRIGEGAITRIEHG